jgi:beta-glucosidase
VLELKGFTRVELEPGARRRVTFALPVDLLSFTGVDGRRIVEPGLIELKVGASSADIRLDGRVQLRGATRVLHEDRALFSRVDVT